MAAHSASSASFTALTPRSRTIRSYGGGATPSSSRNRSARGEQLCSEVKQTWEISAERSAGQRAGVGLGGVAGITLEAAAERAIRSAYAITETKRVTRSDEVSFEVPPGVRRDVRVVQRRVWQHGVVRLDLPDGSVDVPFRVLTNVEIGYHFDDTAQPR